MTAQLKVMVHFIILSEVGLGCMALLVAPRTMEGDPYTPGKFTRISNTKVWQVKKVVFGLVVSKM